MTESLNQVGTYVDISTRPRLDRVTSVVELVVLLILCVARMPRTPWFYILAILLLWDAIRVLSWALEITPQELRVRRYFLWRAIPWEEIRTVGLGDTWGRGQKAVRLGLASQPSLSLGAFSSAFATVVCDSLRAEITQRGSNF